MKPSTDEIDEDWGVDDSVLGAVAPRPEVPGLPPASARTESPAVTEPEGVELAPASPPVVVATAPPQATPSVVAAPEPAEAAPALGPVAAVSSHAPARQRVATEAPTAVDASSEDRRAELRRPWGRILAAAAAVVIGLVGWMALGDRDTTEPKLALQQAGRTEQPSDPSEALQPPESEQPSGQGPGAEAPTPEPSAVASVQATASAAERPADPALISVHVRSIPDQAELYERGQRVGRTPLELDVRTGERRKFEVALPGHYVRKLVIDGSTTDVVVGMRQKSKRGKKGKKAKAP